MANITVNNGTGVRIPEPPIKPDKQTGDSQRQNDLEFWKDWIIENGGDVLAGKLISVPSPISTTITISDFIACFGLIAEPNNDEIKNRISSMKSTFPEWVKHLDFSYMAVVNVTGKLNTSPSFGESLDKLGEILTQSNSGDKFRKMFC